MFLRVPFVKKLRNICHDNKTLVSRYRGRRFIPRMHHYVVSLNKTHYPHCFGPLNSLRSANLDCPYAGCLLMVLTSTEKIALKNEGIF